MIEMVPIEFGRCPKCESTDTGYTGSNVRDPWDQFEFSARYCYECKTHYTEVRELVFVRNYIDESE